MKKFLLMAALAAGTMTANAQVKLDQTKIQKNFAKVEIASEVKETRGMEIVNMYYYRPQGLFYSGWNRNYFNPGISIAPINTTIHFAADYTDGTPAWAYPDGTFDANNEPVAAEYQGESIDLTLPQGTYFTPMIVNMEDQQNDKFVPVGYMEVGGQCRIDETEYNGEIVANDAYAVNYVPTGNIALIPNYLCTNNSEADATFGAQIWQDDTYSTKGFGEFFTSPADMQVKGFNALVYASSNIEKDINKIKASFVSFTGDQNNPIEEIASYKEFDVEILEIEAPNAEGYGVYHLLFQLKGDPITVKGGSNICPIMKTTKIQISPLFDGQPRWDQTVEQNIGITTMMVACETAEGEGYIKVPSLALTNQEGNKIFLNNWCIGLDMSYAPNGFAGIDNVVADEVAGNGAVYTVEGVKVSNGDVENLPAGVYVKDGKKFVVR